MDYSAMTFDAAYIKIPVFLYVYDLRDYINARGELMWDLQKLPFPFAENMEALVYSIEVFDNEKYYEDVAEFVDKAHFDTLAVTFGSAYGTYRTIQTLNWQHVRGIKRQKARAG